jgi:hypothetical protein
MDPLQVFLLDRIEGYEELEVALLLYRQPDDAWTSRSAAERLGIAVEQATTAFDGLEARGLAVRDGNTFRYGPASKELDAAMGVLVRTYDANRIAVIQYLTQNAIERMRTSTVHRFAEAFRVRGKKDG